VRTAAPTTDSRASEPRGAWSRFGALLLITALVLTPLAGTVASALPQPGTGGPWTPSVGEVFAGWFRGTPLYWFENSLALAFFTVIVCVVVGAPAGYVLARGRGRAVNSFALLVFAVQSFPAFLMLVPLFLTFAKIQLVDNLGGVAIIYVGLSLAVAIWMIAAHVGTIPIELEEAAWLDGCSVLGGFFRVVLRNSLPAVLSTAIFTFLFAWNDYLVALLFLRSTANYTVAIGLQSAGRSPTLAVLVALPPVLIFVVLNRYFSIGGIAGSLSGR
jgi:multiple sugar transport system permease protein